MRSVSALLACLILAGCLPAPTQTSAAKSVKRGGAQQKVSPAPSRTGSLALPTTVRLAEGPPLVRGGNQIIATGGLNIIATGGLNIIATGGGNIIATGGLNYQVQAMSLAGLKVTSSLYQYEVATRAIDQLLKSLGELPLEVDQPLSFEDASGKTFTALLERRGDRQVISLGRGTAAKGEEQIVGLSFTSPKQGRALWRHTTPAGKWYFSTEFDLEAGRVVADGASDMPLTPDSDRGMLDLGHWIFERGAEEGAAFSFKEWTYTRRVDQPGTGEAFVALAHFLEDDRGALVFGTRSDDGVFFFFRDDADAGNPEAPHDHYMDANNETIARDAAPARLKALVPSDEAFKRFAPVDPGAGDPFDKPAFKFPE